MDASINGGTPSHHPFHSISIGFSLKNQPFWSTPLCENPHILNRIPVFCQLGSDFHLLAWPCFATWSLCLLRERKVQTWNIGEAGGVLHLRFKRKQHSCSQLQSVCQGVFYHPRYIQYHSLLEWIYQHIYSQYINTFTQHQISTMARTLDSVALFDVAQANTSICTGLGDPRRRRRKSSRHMVVSQNRGTPFLDGISHYKIYKPSIFGLPQK